MKKLIVCSLLFFVLGCEDGMFNQSASYQGLSYIDGREADNLRDRYNDFEENPFINVAEMPVSTFSIDADGGSYANVRRFITENQKPPKAAVRTEELINYFTLNYPEDKSGHPIAVNGEVSQCPWEPEHKLIRVGLKGRTIPREQLPASNIVLLIDVSGSMGSPDKLELLKQSFTLLVNEFTENDKIAIVTYAGAAGVPLKATPGNEKNKIKSAISALGAGGSTAGAQGIITAYEIAQQNFIEGGNNRVILGTDGDFNVGPSSQEELVSLIEKKRDTGIFLTVVGVGRGNYNDAMMEQLADNGNGTYEYIDNITQGKKVFVDEYYKFYPAAKDVKIQVEFNPMLVEAYRLIGYENRVLEKKDFEDDKKDAGEISLGQNITALYEIKPKSAAEFRSVPSFTIQFRYKNPNEDNSIPLSLEVYDDSTPFSNASDHMKFTASVAGFGMLLRESAYKGTLTYDNVIEWTSQTLTFDPYKRKAEFVELVRKARALK